MPVINVDFQNADAEGRVRLNTIGAVDDIARLRALLEEGLVVKLVDGELGAAGRITFSETESIWVAVVDWNEVKPHAGGE